MHTLTMHRVWFVCNWKLILSFQRYSFCQFEAHRNKGKAVNSIIMSYCTLSFTVFLLFFVVLWVFLGGGAKSILRAKSR